MHIFFLLFFFLFRYQSERRPRKRCRYDPIQNPMNLKKSRQIKAAKGRKMRVVAAQGESEAFVGVCLATPDRPGLRPGGMPQRGILHQKGAA